MHDVGVFIQLGIDSRHDDTTAAGCGYLSPCSVLNVGRKYPPSK
jgi:hypothetical protein